MAFCAVSPHQPPSALREAPWNAPEGPPSGLLLYLQWKDRQEDVWVRPVCVPGNPALVLHPRTGDIPSSLLWFNPRVKRPPFRSGQRLHVEGWGWERIPEPPPGDILKLAYDGQTLTVDSVRVWGRDATWHVRRYRKRRGHWKLLDQSTHALTTGPAQGTGQAVSTREWAYAPGWVFFTQGRPEEGVLRVQAWSRREGDEAPLPAPAEEWHLPDWKAYLAKAVRNIVDVNTLLLRRAGYGPGGFSLEWRVSITMYNRRSATIFVRALRGPGQRGVLVMPHPEDVGLAAHDVYWLDPPRPAPWGVLLASRDFREHAYWPSSHPPHLTGVWLTHHRGQGLYPIPIPGRTFHPPILLSGNPLRMLWLEHGGGEGRVAVLDTVEGNRLVRRALTVASALDDLRPYNNLATIAETHPYFPLGIKDRNRVKEVHFWNPTAIEALFDKAPVETYPLRPRGRMLVLPIQVTPGHVWEWR